MQTMLTCTSVFLTNGVERLIHASKQEHHRVSNALKYLQETTQASSALLGLDWWGVQQQAGLSTVADTW
jgi:hypothetical protein